MRRVLVGGVLVLGLAFSLWIAFAARPRAAVRTAAETEAPYRTEIALATAHGLAIVQDTALDVVLTERSLAVDAGECVALVAANEGSASLLVSLMVPGVAATGNAEIVHLAACATSAGVVTITIDGPQPDFRTGAHMHLALLRGRVTEPRTYARLTLTEAQRSEVDANSVRARVDALAPASTRLAEARVADREHAVLVPPTRASFAALRALLGRLDIAPACLDAERDPFASSSDVHVAPRVFTAIGQERVVAVVDAGALGAVCVDVLLARLDDPRTATPLRRERVPDRTVVEVTGSDPAILVDHVCPASGLLVYTTDLGDGADYLVTATSVDAEAATLPAPSDFGDVVTGRHPSSGLVLLPVPMLAPARVECTGGSADACLTLAALARDGIDGAGTVREALEPLCRASGGEVCDVLAGAIQEDAHTSDELEQRACTTGVAAACMRRGARFLAGASDLERAYRTFRFGCDRACTDCCTAASTMTEWQLAPAGASEHPDAPG